MTKNFFFLIYFSFFLLVSCKKDSLIIKDSEEHTTRLNFKTVQEFEELMKKIHSENSRNLDQSVLKYTGSTGFTSLRSSIINGSKKFKNNTITSNNDDSSDSQELEELVPDDFFANVLNEDGEILVQGKLYKVTPFGTFAVAPEKYNRLLEIISSNNFVKDNDYKNHPFYKNKLSDDFYKIEDKILLFDSYNRADGLIGDVFTSQTYAVNDRKESTSSSSDDLMYNNIPTIYYGGKTFVGKLIQHKIGRNETYTEKFEAKRRVKVSFYNISYIIYNSIGAEVKMQKKNWIGWSGTPTSELRLGWDALEYFMGNLPGGSGALPHPAYQYFSTANLPAMTKNYVGIDLLGYNITYDRNVAIQQGAKFLFDQARILENRLFPKPPNVNYAFKVWSDFTKRNISIIQERDELVAYNTESISKVFDWSAGVQISSNFETINVGLPPMGSLSFKLGKSSIYGIAKYGNVWKGARIENQ